MIILYSIFWIAIGYFVSRYIHQNYSPLDNIMIAIIAIVFGLLHYGLFIYYL